MKSSLEIGEPREHCYSHCPLYTSLKNETFCYSQHQEMFVPTIPGSPCKNRLLTLTQRRTLAERVNQLPIGDTHYIPKPPAGLPEELVDNS